MLTRAVIQFAYLLKTSSRYQAVKRFTYDLLENPQSKIKSYFDLFMIILVMVSVFMLIYEIDNKPGPLSLVFEKIVVIIFVAEYLLRGWLYSNSHKILIDHYEKSQYLGIKFRLRKPVSKIILLKIQYVFSIFAIIDLLAILPSYRPLRILRVFLIFRLFKLFRYSQSIKLFSEVLTSKRFELLTLSMFVGFLLFIASTAIYTFENEPDGGNVRHLFDALYWSVVTMSTVGYGDITPQSPGGRVITIMLIILGLGVLSFFTSIIVTSFTEKMEELGENRTYVEISKLKNFVIICGFGRVGQEVARQMEGDNLNFVVIDNSEKNALLAKKNGFLVINNDASNNEILINAGIKKGAKAVLCTTGDDVINLYVTLTSRHLNSDIKIISRVNRRENAHKLKQAGANFLVQPFEISGLLAAQHLGQPVASQAIFGIVNAKKSVLMETILIPKASDLDCKPIGQIDLEKRKLMLLGVISSHSDRSQGYNHFLVEKRSFYFNPDNDFTLYAGDLLVLLGRDYSIDHFKDLLEKSSIT